MFRKNTSGQNLYFALVSAATGAALTGASVTAVRSIDGAAQAAATGSITEDGNGQYHLSMSQADTNGNNIGFLFTATGAIPQAITIVTTAADPTDSVRFGLTAIPNAAAAANGGLPTVDASNAVKVQSGTGANQISLSSGLVRLSTVGAGDVWDTVIASHVTAGSTGAALNSVSVIGDPWSTAVPGAYSAGTAGKILGDNLNATMTSRLAATGAIAIKKNVAFTGFTFPMYSSSTHQLVTGKTVASARSIDGAALASTTNAVTEVGGGMYTIDFSTADLNGNSIGFKFTAVGADDLAFTILTQA